MNRRCTAVFFCNNNVLIYSKEVKAFDHSKWFEDSQNAVIYQAFACNERNRLFEFSGSKLFATRV
jgi:hypothetical protein